MKKLSGLINSLAPFIGLSAIYCLFIIIGPESFSSPNNVETILRQTAIVGTAALGMTLVIVAGGIDLSVGSIIALVSVVIAAFLQAGVSPIVSAAAGIGVAVFCGFINGMLITRLRVVPFIVTLGTMLIIRGAAKGIAREQKIDAPLTWLNTILAALAPGSGWQLVPSGVWITLILAVVVALLLRYMKLGKHVIAVGSNEQTALLCGVPVNRVKVMVYTLSAGFAGVAGLMQFSRLTVGDPTVAIGLELDVIAAVVIGGGSLSGGEGSVAGTIVGALIMTTIRSGCSQMGLPNWVQEIITGTIIVIAVAFDRLRHRRSEARQ
jgi:ribose/xylose/arabinose/galactoside ABC-type transport system permease subunit